MSPRSLLFSSDQETSRLVGQALAELELDVEACPEIFAALRSLTSRTFEVIVVDWDEGPEASFLLKTARDLKSNREAFVIVIGRSDASAALQQAGAALVLSKPINADKVRHDLLTCREFLARMKAWLPQCQVRQTTSNVAGKELWSTALPEPQPAVPATPVWISQPSTDSSAGLTFSTFDDGFLPKSFLQRVFRPNAAGLGSRVTGISRRKAADRHAAVLCIAAFAVAFFAVGYVFSQPLTKAGRSAAIISRAAWATTQNWFQKSPVDVQAAEVGAIPDVAPVGDPETPAPQEKATIRIRVTPVSGTRVSRALPSPAATVATLQNGAALESNRTPQTVVNSAPVRENSIPASLSSPFPGVATVRDVASKITPALLDALEPITVPEQLSEKLLLERVEPSYPQKALQAGLQGSVVLQAWIGKDGRIRDLKLMRGSLLLGQAACEAVRQWRYKPYLLNGQAVDAQTTVTVDFKLP